MIKALKTLAKNVLTPLRLTTAASATDAEIHKKKIGLGVKTLITSNGEMDDIIKIVKSRTKRLIF